MSSLGIFEWTGVVGISLFLAPDAVSRLFDYVVPVYTILSILIVIGFIRLQKSDLQKKERVYNIPRKQKPGVELTWKQKFAGTWDKVEREGWIEFVVFMGVVNPTMAKMLAKTIENQPLQNVITYKDETEREMKVDVLGKPESLGVWVVIANDAASAIASELEADKEKCLEKLWWEEETQTLHRTREFTKTGRVVVQTRNITEDDKLVLVNKTTKPDGSSNIFKVVFKRIS